VPLVGHFPLRHARGMDADQISEIYADDEPQRGAVMHAASSDSGPVAPTCYRVRARSQKGGAASAAAAGVTVPFDASWRSAPSGLPGPAELLASAFAACLLKNLARSGSLLDFTYDDAEVDVLVRRQDAPPKFTEVIYTLRVTTNEPARRVEMVHRNLSKFGTVYNTLAAVCDVHGEVMARPPAARSRENESAG